MAIARGQSEHDHFFRTLMERPKAAGALLRERLAPSVARQMVGDPVLVEGSFIDGELRGSQSDRLFRIALRDQRQADVYCLIEHKSTPDPRVALQLLRYLARIWERLDREAKGSGLLAPVLPMVVYHGKAQWRGPLRFLGMLDAPEDMKQELLDFPFGLVDLGQIPDPELSGEPELMAGFLVLKYSLRVTGKNVEETVARLLDQLSRAPEELLSLATRYIIRGFGFLDRKRIASALRKTRTKEARKMLSKLAKELLAEGEARGVKLGKAQGEAAALLLVLRRRFGELPDKLIERVRNGRRAQLETWLLRSVDAASLDAVFRRPMEH